MTYLFFLFCTFLLVNGQLKEEGIKYPSTTTKSLMHFNTEDDDHDNDDDDIFGPSPPVILNHTNDNFPFSNNKNPEKPFINSAEEPANPPNQTGFPSLVNQVNESTTNPFHELLNISPTSTDTYNVQDISNTDIRYGNTFSSISPFNTQYNQNTNIQPSSEFIIKGNNIYNTAPLLSTSSSYSFQTTETSVSASTYDGIIFPIKANQNKLPPIIVPSDTQSIVENSILATTSSYDQGYSSSATF